MNIDRDQLVFRHPFTGNLCAPSGSGKTHLLRKILLNYKHTTTIEDIKVLWCFGVDQELYKKPVGDIKIDYFNGLPQISDLSGYNCLVLDDLGREVGGNEEMLDLFTRESHHRKISVF